MKKEQDEINYWQSTTDILSALLLVILLVAVVLILYLMGTPKENWREDNAPTPTPTVTVTFFNGYYTERPDDDDDNNGGGGGISYTPWVTESLTPSPTVTETPTPTPFVPTWGGGGGRDEDEEGKAAVYVMIVDAETDKVIPQEGIIFDLLDRGKVRQTLNTYYPVRQWYNEFSTTESGVFYLPEKVLLDGYWLRTEMAPQGYDVPEDTYFLLDEPYDWPSPYVVRIPFSPAKNVIRVRITDAETKEGLAGASFRVIADEDVLTADGTLRYKKGEQADLIVCDEEGNGESIELYLGLYRLEQEDIPKYYAGVPESETVEVVRKLRGREVEPLPYECSRTAIVLTAQDEVYPTRKLQGVPFSVTCNRQPGRTSEETTDEMGRIVLTDLEKDATYHIVQTGSMDNYYYPVEEYTVTVDKTGRIDGLETAELTVTNHIIRVSVSVRDLLLRQSISDISVGLYDEAGQQVSLWSSQASATVLTGLTPGTYRLVMTGTKQETKEITVTDTPDVQEYAFEIFTRTDIAIVIGFALLLVAAVLIAVRVRKHRKKKPEGGARHE